MADTRVTLRPNATKLNEAGLVGATTAHGALSDNSDASYLEWLAGTVGTQTCQVDLTDLALPVGAKIRQVRLRFRGIHTGGTYSDFTVGVHEDPNTYEPSHKYTTKLTSALTEHISPWWTTKPSGGAWTDAVIDVAWMHLADETRDIGANIPEAYLDIEYNELPVGTVSRPTGTVNQANPEAQWVYSDPDNDPQTHFQIVVESGDHTLDASPDLTTNVYNSGEVASSTNVHQLPALAEGTYTAWVRVRHSDVSGQKMYSQWNSELFIIDVLPPAVPTVTTAPDNTNNRVAITVDSNSSISQEAEKYWVEYSDDGGTTWVSMPEGNPITVDPVDSAETIYDYLSPPGTPRQYRARASRTDAGNEAYSAWSAPVSSTITISDWWLKDVLDPSNNMVIEVESDPADIEHPADIAVFNPIGRKYPVVVREATVKAARFTLEVPTIDAATYASLVRLWESGHPMLLQVPGINKQYYVQFNSPRGEQLRNLNDPYRGNTLHFVEIERPSV